MKTIRVFFYIFILLIMSFMIFGKIWRENLQQYHIDIPVSIDPLKSVIYSDFMSGSFYYYRNMYSPKIFHASPCLQKSIIRLYAEHKYSQYVVLDSDRMNNFIQTIGINKFDKLGQVIIAGRNFDFYLIKPSILFEIEECEKSY